MSISPSYNEDEAKETLEGVVKELATDIGLNQWDAYVFESGAFTNTGDQGYDNWTWSGNFERSGDNNETVTFEPIE